LGWTLNNPANRVEAGPIGVNIPRSIDFRGVGAAALLPTLQKPVGISIGIQRRKSGLYATAPIRLEPEYLRLALSIIS
jgi:hypothetical protein